MIKNIIFDVYGTLICTGTGSVDATEKIFKKYNLNEDYKDIYGRWKVLHKMHINNCDIFCLEKEIFQKDLVKLFEEYQINGDASSEVRPMLDSLLNRQIYPDVEETIMKLSTDYNLAIGSTTDTAPLLENISNSILSNITNIYTSESLNVYKPKKKFYTKILENTGWNPEECLFVGDSIDDDIIGPQSVGMKTVLINRRNISDAELLRIPHYIINSLAELPEIITLF